MFKYKIVNFWLYILLMFLRITSYKRKKVNFTLLFIYFSLYDFIEIKNQRKIRRQVNHVEMEFNKKYICTAKLQ